MGVILRSGTGGLGLAADWEEACLRGRSRGLRICKSAVGYSSLRWVALAGGVIFRALVSLCRISPALRFNQTQAANYRKYPSLRVDRELVGQGSPPHCV